MSEYCTFCQIARKEKPASCVYEDDRTMAFLDIRPINDGHTLVIPKKHYDNIYEIPDEEVAYLFKIVKKVATAVKKGMNAEGIRIFQNNGRAASQVVFHIHVHILPRCEGQNSHQPRSNVCTERLDDVARRIKQFI